MMFGDVLLVPDSEKGNSGVSSMGKIGKDGRYTMSTRDANDSAIAGDHEGGIRVLDPEPVATDETPAPDPQAATGKELMAARLQQRKAQSQSLMKNRAKEVAPDGRHWWEGPSVPGAQKLANPETSGIRVRISRGSNRVDFAIAEDRTVKVSQRSRRRSGSPVRDRGDRCAVVCARRMPDGFDRSSRRPMPRPAGPRAVARGCETGGC